MFIKIVVSVAVTTHSMATLQQAVELYVCNKWSLTLADGSAHSTYNHRFYGQISSFCKLDQPHHRLDLP